MPGSAASYRPRFEQLEMRALPSGFVVTALPVAPVAPMQAPPRPTATTGQASSLLSQQVVSYARAHQGSQVGDGQCATLAVDALMKAGARTTFDYGVSGATGDYIWGRLVLQATPGSRVDWSKVQPGDILQFRNAVITSRTGGMFVTLALPHHTAIVNQNLGAGRLAVLEQNVSLPGRSAAQVKTVQPDVIDLSHIVQGTVWVYRPVSR